MSIWLHHRSIGSVVIRSTNHASCQRLDRWPTIWIGVNRGPLTMVIGIRGMDRGGPFHRVLAWGWTVHRVSRVWPGVDIHRVGMTLTSPSRRPGTWCWVIRVSTCGRLVGFVHESVYGVEILMSSGALGSPSLRAASLRPARGSVSALALNPSGSHWLLVLALFKPQVWRLTTFTLGAKRKTKYVTQNKKNDEIDISLTK